VPTGQLCRFISLVLPGLYEAAKKTTSISKTKNLSNDTINKFIILLKDILSHINFAGIFRIDNFRVDTPLPTDVRIDGHRETVVLSFLLYSLSLLLLFLNSCFFGII